MTDNFRQGLEDMIRHIPGDEQQGLRDELQKTEGSDALINIFLKAKEQYLELDTRGALLYAARILPISTNPDNIYILKSLYNDALQEIDQEGVGVVLKHLFKIDNEEPITSQNLQAVNNILDSLRHLSFYEELLDFDPSDEVTATIFAEFHPADALLYAMTRQEDPSSYVPGKRLKHDQLYKDALSELQRIIQESDVQKAYEVLEVYQRLGTDYASESALKDLLTEEALKNFPLRAELYQLCLEADDSFYWDIGKSMLDDETIATFPDEAQVLAYEAGEEELVDKIRQQSSGRLLPGYAALMATAKRIVNVVGRDFNIDLPQKVTVGGYKGSYASIRREESYGPPA